MEMLLPKCTCSERTKADKHLRVYTCPVCVSFALRHGPLGLQQEELFPQEESPYLLSLRIERESSSVSAYDPCDGVKDDVSSPSDLEEDDGLPF